MVLTADSCCAGKHQQHLQNIRRVREQLLRSVRRANCIVGLMYQEKQITERERQNVECQKTMCNKAHQLVNLIANKPVEIYECLLRALKETNQEYLCSLLQNEGNVRWDVRCYVFPLIMGNLQRNSIILFKFIVNYITQFKYFVFMYGICCMLMTLM